MSDLTQKLLPFSLQDFFMLGMKRRLPELYEAEPVTGLSLNLGAGKHQIPGTVALDYPAWDADRSPIPYPDGAADTIHAYHFLEHVADPLAVLREIQRVLRRGGVVNICVPHYLGSMAYHDFTHRRAIALDSWRNFLDNPFYLKDREGWTLREHINLIMAVTERNMAIFTQLVKD